MADIVINEISQNYSYVIGNESFATVALPITSQWGPGYFEPDTMGISGADRAERKVTELEDTVWQRFPANQAGIEAFVSMYRGPANNYRLAKDYSYQMAMTLLSAGYDVLVCRLNPGTYAQAVQLEDISKTGSKGKFILKAKYVGSFGNRLLCTLKKMRNRNCWNLITYIIDSTGVKFSVENKTFTFEIENSSDSVLHLDEIESDYVDIKVDGVIKDSAEFTDVANNITFSGGADRPPDPQKDDGSVDVDALMEEAIKKAKERYDKVMHVNDTNFNSGSAEYRDEVLSNAQYIRALYQMKENSPDPAVASTRAYQEWLYTEVMDVYDLLLDRLSYAPNRIISPGWDDQDILELTPDADLTEFTEMSPLHWKLMYVAYYARCGTSYIDVPKSMKRKYVYNGSLDPMQQGYVQMLSRYQPTSEVMDIDGTLYPTHSAMFGPWGTYKYVGTNKYCPANPGFLALMIERSMLKNQAIQAEWMQPSNRECNVKIGKMAYTVPQKILDTWQPEPDQEGGCGVNAIGDIPSLGLSIWGDSTIYENPPAVYQALRNLSTRKLVNALKNQAYKIGLSITWRYNNESAYSKFFVGMTPLLDAMRNAGAIEDYYVRMSADLDKTGAIKANSVLGKVYIVPVGTVQKITIDLISMPPGTALSQYTAQ